MPVVNLHDSLHERAKRLALDTKTTLTKLVHEGVEWVVSKGEAALAQNSKKAAKK